MLSISVTQIINSTNPRHQWNSINLNEINSVSHQIWMNELEKIWIFTWQAPYWIGQWRRPLTNEIHLVSTSHVIDSSSSLNFIRLVWFDWFFFSLSVGLTRAQWLVLGEFSVLSMILSAIFVTKWQRWSVPSFNCH